MYLLLLVTVTDQHYSRALIHFVNNKCDTPYARVIFKKTFVFLLYTNNNVMVTMIERLNNRIIDITQVYPLLADCRLIELITNRKLVKTKKTNITDMVSKICSIDDSAYFETTWINVYIYSCPIRLYSFLINNSRLLSIC
jgi:hypothetical protein